MKVYELTHKYYIFEGEPCYSEKSLGYFETLEQVEEAIAFYATVPGFCDCPKGFVVRNCEVRGEVKDGMIYSAWVYTNSFDYVNYEETIDLGWFGNLEDAERAVEEFRSLNARFLSNDKLEIEVDWGANRLNQLYWTEGFEVVPLED